ncbi:hypothetical protein [Ammoniphilus sp. YIM 78166]|uniref:hypothetical protein n=1 Tax=Ammoniphilus sp. YIM 78166 TaxID=1644106 RepID=UPI0014309E32|nr:hypothetical protein [Ammoniphilus sp. YIM 78166]
MKKYAICGVSKRDAGAYSIVVGEAVWRSCQENKSIKIHSLLQSDLLQTQR